MRVLGIDFGERRIGVAASDPSGLIARSAGIITRRSNREAAARVAEMAGELEAGLIVIGLPLDSAGQEGHQARRVRRFGTLLEELVDVPVVYWDESLSSVDAGELLTRSGAPRKRRQGPMDDVAAAVMLQSYLDSRRPSEI